MVDICIELCGMKFFNLFVIGLGFFGINYKIIVKCFRVGWGGVVVKIVSLDDIEVVNVVLRYGKYCFFGKDVIGFQNIELIFDCSLGDWFDDFKRCKDDFLDYMLIVFIME